jgi:predicted polyphosphate/ATP-dependent NAD kinase
VINIGIIANPASGKDVRRLVARASVFDNPEKQAIVQRIIAGLEGVLGDSDWQICYLDDAHGIVRRAITSVLGEASCRDHPVMTAETGSAIDTTRAARALKEASAAITLSLGGDGTNRALSLGWRDAPLIPLSTGTNNVFPRLMEATVAGAAAGLVASGRIPIAEVARQQKVIRVEIEDEADDLALVDAVFVNERFIGARALLHPESLSSALLTIADPSAVGITSIGGLIEPLTEQADQGMQITFARLSDADTVVRAPIAPGYYREVGIRELRKVSFQQSLRCEGPGVLAFDGERERVLKPGQSATLTVERTGPHVVDVPATLRLAAGRGCFLRTGGAMGTAASAE